MIENLEANRFELDTIFGYINIGYYWNDGIKYATIIDFENPKKIYFYRLEREKWVLFHEEREIDYSRAYPINFKLLDFNFDNVNDIAVHYCTSNGCAIESYFLWLKLGDSLKFIPN